MSTDKLNKIKEFINYTRTLKGDEKGESQVFCDRLFQAFSHGGYKEAGAELEFYTSEADIQKVILPTIVRPWRERRSIYSSDWYDVSD